jgi:FKBP-type peptidyl-prolyl cis-trans isomerase 2
MKTKLGDFVELKYVGRLDNGTIFDLNDKALAKKEGFDSARIASQTIVCVGKTDVVPGLDEELSDKELGKEFSVSVPAEKGFGKKEAELIQMLPLKKFKEHNINPVPGLQLNIDNMVGVVKTVSGGRVMVDFNHPLAGKTLNYTVTVVREVKGIKEKVSSFIKLSLHLPECGVEEKDGIVTIDAHIPDSLHKPIENELKERISQIKGFKWVEHDHKH